MKIDMHVHTTRYSGCSTMSPDQMAAAAIRNGLDAVVITEHNVMWTQRETAELQATYPELKIFRGVEVTTAQGDMLVYGITDDTAFFGGMPVGKLVANVHQDGGIVVLAHPCRYQDKTPEDVFAAGVDGVEMMSSNIRGYMLDGIRIAQERLNVPCIVNSDGHTVSVLGIFANDFHRTIKTEQDLVWAVKNQQYTIFYDADRIATLNNTSNYQPPSHRRRDMRLVDMPIWLPTV